MKYWMCDFHEQNGEHEYTFIRLWMQEMKMEVAIGQMMGVG